ncbi:MAG: hypothetical protein PWQ83_634 [Thermosipho sp. (in: thermotogales)]|nr:hypothetical protein [Thermosipho sp. (in: thermotogales)]
MQIENVRLVFLTVLVLFLNFFRINGFTIFLDAFVIIQWINYSRIVNIFKDIDIEVKLDKDRVFIDEDFNLIISLCGGKVPLHLSVPELGEGKVYLKDVAVLKHSFAKRGKFKIEKFFLKYDAVFFNIIKKVEKKDIQVKVFPNYEEVYFRKEKLLDLVPNVVSKIRLLEDPTSIIGVRKYEKDPIKMINWKISAKLGDIYVKQTEYTSQGRLFLGLFLNLHSQIFSKTAWRPILNKYVEDAILAANSIVKEVSARNIPVKLIADTSEGIKKEFSSDWIDYYEVLSTSYGSLEGFSFEVYNEIEREIIFNDTLLIITMFLSEKDLEKIMRIRERVSRIIILVMPYGFRRYNTKKFKSYLDIPQDIEAIKKNCAILRENDIHVIVYLENMLLQEGIELVN